MDDWIGALLACRRDSEAAALITVASSKGSVPREAGTRMVVTTKRQHGTIGGGHLEMQAIGIAREMLAGLGAGGLQGFLRRFPLGASLGQCCGGVVHLMFEAVEPGLSSASWLDEVARCRGLGEACVLVSETNRPMVSGSMVVTAGHCSGSLGGPRADALARALAKDVLSSRGATRLASLAPEGPLFLFDPIRGPELDICLFGAGHVGQSLIRVLAELPCRVTWIDERADLFPDRVPANIRIEVSDTPLSEVQAARAGSCFLVMTHSHALDQALAEAILLRGDFLYFGLIGSLTKRRQFERRLAARGVPAEALARMTCPIGISGIDGKEPGAIAIAVAAELLLERSRLAPGGGRLGGDGGAGETEVKPVR